jgi:hypothetical protein
MAKQQQHDGAGAEAKANAKAGKSKANDKKRITPKKPKARVQRLLKKREPQLVEGAKCALLMRGTKCPDELRGVLKDLVRRSTERSDCLIDCYLIEAFVAVIHRFHHHLLKEHPLCFGSLPPPSPSFSSSHPQTKLLKPNAKMLNRKNEIRPFEDVSSLEFLLDKNDCALFAVGTHNKKRPLNLIMVRSRRL